MKILFSTAFYPPYHLGGDATHVKYLAEELAKAGHEIHVIHSLDAYRVKRGKSRFQEDPENSNIHVHRISSTPYQKDPYFAYFFGASPKVQKTFEEIIKKEKPDVVHHHNISLLGYSILEKKGSYLSLYTAHDYWLICQTSNLMKDNGTTCDGKHCFSCAVSRKRLPQMWRQTKYFKKATSNIDLLISPSDYLRKRLLQDLAINSVTVPNFAPLPPSNISKLEFEKYFLFVGMLEKHKGILQLLKVFSAHRREIDAHLVISGGGSLAKEVKSYIETHALGDKISFLGFVNNQKLYALYSGATALIIPSIWPENAPLVTLEALSVGTPVLGSDRGGLPEILGKVDKNLIFQSTDDLAKKIISFQPASYEKKRVKEIFNRNFSPQAYLEKYTDLVGNMNSAYSNVMK